ncbi:MAG: MerR family transcriptional regulator [Coriobacteriales bacterium]|jgi:DNA-binding transcriptional MerR regulator/effector-binding domain-containing protein|nr:MerR family transcriptional regulator [Coriobacteriales bacterium]
MDDDGSLLISVKEFSEFTGVKQSVLRYYDAIGLFKPEARGENNYRYYSLSQIQTIKLIDTLRNLKIPLKKIKDIMHARDPESMNEVFTHYELHLTNELKMLQESFSLVHMLRTLIQGSISQDVDEISVRFVEDARLTLGPLTDFRSNESYYRVYSEYYRSARSSGVNLSYPIGGYFDTVEEFQASPSRPKRYFSLDPNGLDVMPAGTYLTAFAQGGYGEMGDLPERIGAYMEENGIARGGPVYQIYMLNEVSVQDPQAYLQRTMIKVDRGPAKGPPSVPQTGRKRI